MTRLTSLTIYHSNLGVRLVKKTYHIIRPHITLAHTAAAVPDEVTCSSTWEAGPLFILHTWPEARGIGTWWGHVHNSFSYFGAHEVGQEFDELIIISPDW